MTPLKVFIGNFTYKSEFRTLLVDLLKPIIPEIDLGKYQLTSPPVEIIPNHDESDCFLLPFNWNYYIKTKTVSVARKLIEQARDANKQILIWVIGDYYYSLPQFDNVIGFYTSQYQSMQNVRTISLPVIIRDPLSFLELDAINLREFNKIPSVGFCGQVDSNLIISLIKMAKLVWQNMRYSLNLSQFYSGPFIPPTYLRKKILNILNRSGDLHTDFFRRSRYQGGESKNMDSFQILRKEFYENIKNTDYTLCIRGTGNFSARFYETLALGRIPVFINTDCILPFNDIIDWKKHLIWIDEHEISNVTKIIIDFHNNLTQDSFKAIQMSNRKLWEEYFTFPGFTHQLISYLKKEIN